MVTQNLYSAHVVFIVYNTPCLYGILFMKLKWLYLASVYGGYISVWLLYTEFIFILASVFIHQCTEGMP